MMECPDHRRLRIEVRDYRSRPLQGPREAPLLCLCPLFALRMLERQAFFLLRQAAALGCYRESQQIHPD